MFSRLLCTLGFHIFPQRPTSVETPRACITITHHLCIRGCGEDQTRTDIHHQFGDDDVCDVCGLNRDYVPRRASTRLTSDIERDPDADPHEWLGSDINLRR